MTKIYKCVEQNSLTESQRRFCANCFHSTVVTSVDLTKHECRCPKFPFRENGEPRYFKTREVQ